MYNETAVHIEWIKFSYISIYMYREWKWKFNCGVPAWYGWDLLVCLWYLPHTCFAQIARPSATRFIRVFDDGDNEVLSVDVSTSTDAIYSDDTVTITTSTSFFTNRMYYLLADSGLCVCVFVRSGHVCICMCVCACEQADRQVKVRAYMCACMRTNLSCLLLPLYTPVLYLQVLLLLLHSAQLSQLPSHYPLNGHLESLIQVHVIFCSTFICTTYIHIDAWLIVSLREYCECTRSNGYTYPSTVCKNFRMIPINDNWWYDSTLYVNITISDYYYGCITEF